MCNQLKEEKQITKTLQNAASIKVMETILKQTDVWRKQDSLRVVDDSNRGLSIASYNLLSTIVMSDSCIPRELKNELTKIFGKMSGKSGRFAKYYVIEKEPEECVRCHNKELKYFGPSEISTIPVMKCMGCGYNMSCPKRKESVST